MDASRVEEILRISASVAPLGLQEARWRFWQSLHNFCETYRGCEEEMEQLNND